MKRLLFTFLTLLAVALPMTASAQAKLKTVQVGFHTSVGSLSEGGPGYSAGDSLWVYRGAGVADATTLPVDTTMSVGLRQFVMPGPVYTTATASDTVAWLRVEVYPDGNSPTVAGDTLHVQMQVSDNNEDWTSVVWTGPKISPVVSAMGAIAVLEAGTSNTFHFIVRQVVGGVTQSVFNYLGTTAPTANQVYGFANARFLIQGDHTGRYVCKVTGFVPN